MHLEFQTDRKRGVFVFGTFLNPPKKGREAAAKQIDTGCDSGNLLRYLHSSLAASRVTPLNMQPTVSNTDEDDVSDNPLRTLCPGPEEAQFFFCFV